MSTKGGSEVVGVNTGGTKRKLTTIMAADVVGYSRLVAADDEATVRRLHGMHDVIEPLIKRHEGRLFGEAGDSLMAEFPSSVEAVRCALAIQEEVAARNADAAPEHAMQFRVAIDIGEVIVEGENLYGDGVNIAARLQEVAGPGGVVLSAAAYDQIKHKVSVDVEPLGPRNLKNISDAVTVFRLRMSQLGQVTPTTARVRTGFGWRRRAMAGAAALALLIGGVIAWDIWAGPSSQVRVFKAEAAQPVPAEPSIVVMPFQNASEHEAQEFFGLGISEDIMTSLTKLKGLFVVGRDSAMSFKGKIVPARQVGRELGVRYVLQGSVRRADNRVRISTYLVDAATEQTVWAGRYDRELGDIFAVQDDIAGKIVNAVSVSFSPGERENLRQQYAMAPKFSAYDLFLKGRQEMHPPSPGNLKVAEQSFRDAIALDPNFAGGYQGLSRVASLQVMQGFARTPTEREAAIRAAEEAADQAMKLDPRASMSKMAMASVKLLRRQPKEAVALAKEAYDSMPGDTYVAATYGLMLTFAGDTDTTLGLFDEPRPGPIDVALERERVPIFRLRSLYFKMFAAYEAGIYSLVDLTHKTLLESGGRCFANCLAYAAAAKLHLADDAAKANDVATKGRIEADIAQLASQLKSQYADYPQRIGPWLSMYDGGEDGIRAQRFKSDLDIVYRRGP